MCSPNDPSSELEQCKQELQSCKEKLEVLSEKRLFWECSILGWVSATVIFGLLFSVFRLSDIPFLEKLVSAYRSTGAALYYYPLGLLFTPFIKRYFMHKRK